MNFGLFSSFCHYHRGQGSSKEDHSFGHNDQNRAHLRQKSAPWVSSSQAHHEEEEEGSTGKTRQKTGNDSGQRAQKHDFNLPYLASDIEFDYENFLSADEDYEEERPVLKRSESSESVFANIYKTDNFFDKVSGFY
ncbi:hypothetical protein L3Y34_011486 [Caenorhabditis briggsae]|uniref:Uncharacterized protein n=1 Tax=Caenorhabditis briggsae TaxID=6238 RepID=A0AAE8ZNZ0_CAEBR|nr:hypothetical protein L3Y34_011486 [Caenorhabditis briggsae]